MTMNCIDIDSSQHELYNSWRKLYTVSFPIFEQRTQEQQEKAFSCADYHLVGYSEGDMFVGFISYWEFGSYRYIEHFARITRTGVWKRNFECVSPLDL